MEVTTIYLCVGDHAVVNACRAFYGDTLGLELESEVADHSVWFKASGLTLGFHVGEPAGNPQAVAIGLMVNDVDREHDRLRNLGVPIAREPYEPGWAARTFLVTDPAGHTVQLAQPH